MPEKYWRPLLMMLPTRADGEVEGLQTSVPVMVTDTLNAATVNRARCSFTPYWRRRGPRRPDKKLARHSSFDPNFTLYWSLNEGFSSRFKAANTKRRFLPDPAY